MYANSILKQTVWWSTPSLIRQFKHISLKRNLYTNTHCRVVVIFSATRIFRNNFATEIFFSIYIYIKIISMKCYDLTNGAARSRYIIWVIDNSVIISTKQRCYISFHNLGFAYFLNKFVLNIITFFSKLCILILNMPKILILYYHRTHSLCSYI